MGTKYHAVPRLTGNTEPRLLKGQLVVQGTDVGREACVPGILLHTIHTGEFPERSSTEKLSQA